MRIPPRVERELRWFYLDSDGAIGLRSSYGAMIAGIQGLRGGEREADIDERRILAAERARKIQRSLERCSSGTRDVLRSAFGVVTQISTAGVLSHVMLCVGSFIKSWRKFGGRRNRERYLLALLRDKDMLLVMAEIRRDAERTLHAAIQEYNLQEAECTSGRLTQSQSWQRLSE